jgi:eukaryotic-like serine/threonine-protein kinase
MVSRAKDPERGLRYEPLLELGSGGMGKVLLARARGASGFERLVAIKRMNPELAEAEALVRRFTDEARIAAHVRHANVVSVHDFGRDDEGLFLVLDYVEGVSFEDLILRTIELGSWLDPAIVLRVIADALAGLHAVHVATDPSGQPLNILHRDVSTQNVLIGCDGLSRLSDFGVAKSVLATAHTARHQLLGKLLYMPPEYLLEEPIDRTLDVYAMGMTLWIGLTGMEPWHDVSDATLMSQILHEDLPSITNSGLKIAPELEAIVKRATARDRAVRYPDAAAMGKAIDDLGRRTGWMASHGDVARALDHLCGERLQRLRSEIREAHLSTRPPAPATHVIGTPGRASSEPPLESSREMREKRWSTAPIQRIRVAPRNQGD